MQTSRKISRISLFPITFGTILMFSKFNNFDTRRLSESRRLFLSFCCTIRRVFEPLHVFEPGFNTDKYGTSCLFTLYKISTVVSQTKSRRVVVSCKAKKKQHVHAFQAYVTSQSTSFGACFCSYSKYSTYTCINIVSTRVLIPLCYSKSFLRISS